MISPRIGSYRRSLQGSTARFLLGLGLILGLSLGLGWPGVHLSPATASELVASGTTRRALPEPVVEPHSTEICMNSRISYHGGWSPGASEQMLADVLYAAARAPVIGASRTIYVATSTAVSIYDSATHSLVTHKAGDWRSDATAAFEVGVAAANILDAGAAMHLAQLESVALWTGTANPLASCPRASATTYANSHWDPIDPIDIVICFGLRSVPGLTTTLVAVSSDGSLPNPNVDGSVFLDNALADLAYDSTFATQNLTPVEVSELLWAAYGCSNHYAAGSKAGLVCASAVANFYLTRRIYSIGPDGVYRFHNRRPPGSDATTRDHRIELVRTDDARPALRQDVARLPQAPHYLILCLGSQGDWPELEVGFAAMGALLEATTMDLQGYVTAGLSVAEQAAIRQATGIPSADLPIALVSLGQPSDISGVRAAERTGEGLRLDIENRIFLGGPVVIHYEVPVEVLVRVTIHDCLGHEIVRLIEEEQANGPNVVRWDGRDDRGRPVPSGVYFCRVTAGNLARSVQVVLVQTGI